jgi:hypothetical protein
MVLLELNFPGLDNDLQPKTVQNFVQNLDGRIALAGFDIADGMKGKTCQLSAGPLGNPGQLAALANDLTEMSRSRAKCRVVFHYNEKSLIFDRGQASFLWEFSL